MYDSKYQSGIYIMWKYLEHAQVPYIFSQNNLYFSKCASITFYSRYADRVKGLSVNEKDNDYLDPLMEESNESIQEEEISRDQMCIDMLASNNSEEFSPLMAKIAKQQQIVDQSEEKVLDYVSTFIT